MSKLWQLNAFWLLLLLLHLCPIHHCQVEKNHNKESVTVSQNKSKNMTDSELELEFSRRLSIFSLNVYNQLTLLKPNENIVFSPFSIQTCVAMARMGAKGATAEELDRGLGLVSNDNQEIAQSFHKLLVSYANSSNIQIANKIFVMQGFTLNKDYNKLLTEQFLSAPENIDFSNSNQAAATINKWVEEKTHKMIKDLIQPSALNSDSRLVLVNAIHFKGIWEHKFSERTTRPEDFYINDSEKKKVPMMNTGGHFNYADLSELDATALELPYKDSELSMLVILPKNKTGLPHLEEKLRSVPLNEITKKLKSTRVEVKLPKFKAEFQIDLNTAFQKLGMPSIFSGTADFSGILQNPEHLKISKIIHKAFIDVNEQGTEAAAATGIVMRKKRSIISLTEPIEFFADHPFIYALLHQTELPIFWGSVMQLDAWTDNCPTTSQEHDEL